MGYTKIILPQHKKSQVFALGAQSKSSLCFVKEGTAYLPETDGDLSDSDNLRLFEKRLRGFIRKMEAKPDIIACDMHPGYISTKLARDLAEQNSARLSLIQHHEAHIASCIAENNIKGNVIGVSFDGTGFGRDGNIWGGEFFVGSLKGFKRAAHLRYIPMPGGESAVREPWRMALSYLYNSLSPHCRGTLKFPYSVGRGLRVRGQSIDLLIQAIDKGINSPLTSSMGRLFDAVSSLAGVCSVAEYEGQAAVELEKKVKGERSRVKGVCGYKFDYKHKNDMIIIDWSPLIKGIVADLKKKKTQAEISLKFHNAVCGMIKDVCNLLRKKYRINKVCLSGGVFQNKYLTANATPALEKEGFRIYLHKRFPTHDGNIALGQAVLAR